MTTLANASHNRKKRRSKRLLGGLHNIEDWASIAVLASMILLPVIQIIYRYSFNQTISGVDSLVQHGTLFMTALAAMVTAREKSHLRFETMLVTGDFGLVSKMMKLFSGGVSVAVLLALVYASYLLVKTGMDGSQVVIKGFPVWAAQLILPLALGIVAVRYILQGGDTWPWRAGVFLLAALILTIGFIEQGERDFLQWPLAFGLVIAVIVGAPIFVLLGGMAALFYFVVSFGDISALIDIPDAAYGIVTNPFLPAIPLFTVAGAVLAYGKTSERLVGLFGALFGWMPGGVAIATALLFAFFTTFTGASGVTILALGPLLMPLLIKHAYPERFSLGVLTSAGSLGMLFPPCLPVILIGVTLAQPINEMFLAGLLPGMMLIGIIGAYAVFVAMRTNAPKESFAFGKLKEAIFKAKWEIFLPVIVLGGIFGGVTTLVESAAVTALYAIFIEVVVYRDYDILKGLKHAMIQGVKLMGGILIIIGLAKGFTQFLISEMIADSVAEWVQAAIENKYVFLIILNILLLVVGSMMDIVSAIIVIVPLISPMLGFYNIHPIHFGIIFLVNLEIGFLTPPVGMNLFMSSYTFNKPLTRVYRSVLPFILLWLIAVLLVSYVPALSLAFLD